MAKVKVHKIRCLRCGHIWIPDKEEVVVCAKCHSPYWNIKKKVKILKSAVDNKKEQTINL